MAARMTPTFGYDELEMSRVDAQLQEHRELLIALPPERASVLIGLIEGLRALLRSPAPFHRLRLLGPLLYACLRVIVFHRRLGELARVIVYFSANATWTVDRDGQYIFRFSR